MRTQLYIQLNGNFNCVWKNIFTIIYSPLRACLYIYLVAYIFTLYIKHKYIKLCKYKRNKLNILTRPRRRVQNMKAINPARVPLLPATTWRRHSNKKPKILMGTHLQNIVI